MTKWGIASTARAALLAATAGVLIGCDDIQDFQPAGFPTQSASLPDFTLPATSGSVSLSSGFLPDPHTAHVVAGGGVFVSHGGCEGYVAEAPDYRLNYTAGFLPLNIFVRSNEDTILLVNGPNAAWHCNDDFDGLNPALHFDPPMSGQYDIWVGTYRQGAFPQATLHISEISD